MRKLKYSIDLKHFREIKKEIVPALFTEHQFELIEKKAENKALTLSEKNEFSRTISKKMNAISKIMKKEDIFIYGKEKIRKDRLSLARAYLKRFSRKFKNKHIFISGSFLYKEKYNDIDVFVISQYEKEDYKSDGFHINYLTESVYNSLFFASIKKLCVSNRELFSDEIKEEINIDTFISLYQELFNDLENNFKGIRKTLREFLMQAAFIGKMPIPDSSELYLQTSSILGSKKPKEIIRRIFVKSVVIGIKPEKAIISMKEMIDSYKDIIKEYKQHKNYYLDIIQGFKEVISIES